jgi:hypothetical protein
VAYISAAFLFQLQIIVLPATRNTISCNRERPDHRV